VEQPDVPPLKLSESQAALLERITTALRRDARVAAAWLTGSFGRGEADVWSDFDLHVAVYDAHFPAFLDDIERVYRCVGRPILIQGHIESNAQAGGRFQLVLYQGPIEVDWNVGPLSMAWRPRTSLVLFNTVEVPIFQAPLLAAEERRAILQERVIFFWAMAPIGIKYVARGATARAVGMIGLLSGAWLALRRLLEDPLVDPRLTGMNVPAPADMPRLAREIDASRCLAVMLALFQEVERMHPALRELGVQVPEEVPAAVRALTETIP
jgi:predicted nucleotidyltransferase